MKVQFADLLFATVVPAPPPPSTSSAAPSTTSAPPAPTSTSTSSKAAEYTPPVVKAYVEKEKPKPAAPKPAAPKPETPKAPSNGGGYSVGGTGNHWAITYSPYQGDGNGGSRCKTKEEVDSDVAGLAGKGFKTLRIYATDCDHLPHVGGAAKAHGLKLIVGIFIKETGICQDTYDQLNDIKGYFSGDYSIVEAVLIGNEAIFNGFVSASSLADFIGKAKQTLKGDGYAGPVSTADTVAAIQANGATLCPVIDIVAANIHPFFNGAVLPSAAGDFMKTQMDILGKVCGGSKPVISSETGWPHGGPNHGSSSADYSSQAVAIKSLLSLPNSNKIVFFADSDDLWKAGGSKDSNEPWFGCGKLFS